MLLAPALDFGRRPVGDLGDAGMARWRDTGWWELTHYSSGESTRVHYELFRDAQRYDAFAARRDVPTLVLQGRRDAVVDPGHGRAVRGGPAARDAGRALTTITSSAPASIWSGRNPRAFSGCRGNGSRSTTILPPPG